MSLVTQTDGGSSAELSAADVAVEDDAGGRFEPAPPPPGLRPPGLLGVAILDADLRYRRIDADLAAINGLAPADHLGRTPAEVLPDLAGKIVPLMRAVLNTGEPALSRPIRGTTRAAPEGRRWVAGYYPLPPAASGDGSLAGVVAVVREVDAELTLRPRGVSDARFRELVTRASVGIAQCDPAGRFLYVNDRFCELAGRSRRELVGRPPGTGKTQREITHPHDADETGEKFERAVADGEPYLIDKRLRRPDGKSVWVRNTVTVLPAPDGTAESVFAVVVDMTDRVRTERALRRSQDRLRLATEAGGLGVWAFDLAKGTADWSPEALAIYGGGFAPKPTMADLRARVFDEDWAAIAEDVSADADRPDAGAHAAARRFDLTHRVVHPPNTGVNDTDEPALRWVRSLGEIRFDAEGRPAKSAGVLRDVTAEREAADRLATSERRLRQALDAAELGTFEYDPATESTYWDARTRAIFGVDGPEYRGREHFAIPDEMLERTHPDDRPAMEEALAACFDPAGDGKYDFTGRVALPDGAVRWQNTVGETRFAGEGADRRVVGTHGTVRDVTEAVERDRRLAEERVRLRLAAGAGKLGMYELDLDTDRLWWDDRSREIFDFPPGEGGTGRDSGDGTGIPLVEGMGRLHPEDAPAVAARLDVTRGRARGGEPAELRLEYRVVRRDGGHTHVRSDGEVRVGRWGPGGTVATRVVGFLRDVTAEVERERRLAETADRLALAAEAAELGAYEIDLRAGTVWWDGRVREWYGVPGAPETVPLAEAFARVLPDDRPAVEAAMAEAHGPGGSARFRYEYRVRDAAGAERWCRAHGTIQFAEVDGAGGRETVAVSQTGYVQDITAEKHREEADAAHAAELAARAAEIAEAEERRRLAATAAGLGAFDFDPRTGAVWWDARARDLFDLPDEICDVGTALARIHPDDRPGVEADLAAALAGERDSRFTHEYRVVRPDGSERWVRSYDEVRFAAGADDARHGGEREAVRVVGCLQDVTDRKRAEIGLAEAKRRLETENDRLEAAVADRTAELARANAELNRKNAQLRAAAERIGEVARRERDRVAHVLHDELQQILVGAKMNLSVLTAACEGQNAEIAGLVAGLVDDAIAESRALSAELAPPILRTAGLAPALHWLAGQFETRHGLPVEADCDAEVSATLDDSAAALLFAAARECLLNAVKHADADAARLRLDADPAGVVLTVSDDGRGFDPAARAADGKTDGFGMSDLRQRVDLLGGEVAVESAPGAGCAVRVRLPA